MKVILLRDVAKIGKRFSIVSVPDGYALNRLLPQGDAKPATPANVKQVLGRREKIASNKQDVLTELKQISEAVNQDPLVIKVSANEKGHLFQSVHPEDVVASAKERGLIIEKEFVIIKSSIKELGEFEVTLKNQSTEFPLRVSIMAK